MPKAFRCSPVLFSCLTALVLLAGCASQAASPGSAGDAPMNDTANTAMNPIGESYVKLALDVGGHDPDYVDAYYGPPEWRTAAEGRKRPLAEIRSEAQGLLSRLEALRASLPQDEMLRLRHQYLTSQISSLVARVDMLSGKKLSFDEETRALYDVSVPRYDEAHFQAILDNLDRSLPGEGTLTERYEALREGVAVPRDRVDAVFRAATEECRRRTAGHIPFPEGESFVIEYVEGKPWAGYNWYQGNFKSLIQVNTDLPVYVDRAVDIACHEGYPGHHLYNALLEKELVRGRGWVEASIYPLFSPQSFIAEGTANYGILMAFPGEERVAYERDVLFPLAGLDAGRAARYYQVQSLLRGLSYAANEAARRYLNGEASREQTLAFLQRFGLMNEKRADQQIRFIDQYRSYVINYNVGRDLVQEYIERGNPSRDERWNRFERLLASPRLPSGLKG